MRWQRCQHRLDGSIGRHVGRYLDRDRLAEERLRRALPPDHALQFAVELHCVAVEWVRLVERAYERYAGGETAACITELEKGQAVLERLRPGIEHAVAKGGSATDLARLDLLKEKLARACRRLTELGPRYRPAFQTLVHDAYVPGDQAAWQTAGSQQPFAAVMAGELLRLMM